MKTLNDYKQNILSPKSRILKPLSVREENGEVLNSQNAVLGKSFTLKYNKSGKMPEIILDFGESTASGYLVFTVKSFSDKMPKIRFSYSDWYDYIVDKDNKMYGDYKRGTCKYLGIEVPVLPADPYRYNIFYVSYNGAYVSPLIQGQQRFVRIALEEEDTFAEIENVYFYYTPMMYDYTGAFDCSDKLLTKLWYASAYTCEIASIDNSHSWDNIKQEKVLLLRALTKGKETGLAKTEKLSNYKMSFKGAIFYNPAMVSGLGIALNAQDTDNGFSVFINSDGSVKAYIRTDGVLNLIAEGELSFDVIYNKFYNIECLVNGGSVKININGKEEFSFKNNTYTSGVFGFCQTTEKWALVKELKVETVNNENPKENKVVWFDDFSGDLSGYEFTRSKSFIADGAKRDRLPWLGDIKFGFPNLYYAFSDMSAVKNTLRMFKNNQNPNGYISGVCFPEDTQKPTLNDLGYYESDTFSAWMNPTVREYILYSDDKDFAREMYGCIKNNANYLLEYVDKTGIFHQRYATGKGVWDLALNDYGLYTYTNLLVADTVYSVSYIANYLGKTEDAEYYNKKYLLMKKAIKEKFYLKDKGYFIKGDNPGEGYFCDVANPYALYSNFFDTKEEAKKCLDALLPNMPGYAKMVLFTIKGAYNYGFAEDALKAVYNPYFKTENEGKDREYAVNWLKSLNDNKGPVTTWECMVYPADPIGRGEAWGDKSHPDACIGCILSEHILGVVPTKPGYKEFTVCPKPGGKTLTYANGIVPTPYGEIFVSWEIKDNNINITVNHPKEIVLKEVKAENSGLNCTVILNGKNITD